MADDEKSTVKLYNPNDGLTGRDGGPYLDQVEMHDAETRRAAIEGRDPDYSNLQATAGVPLVPATTLVNMANGASVPSQEGSSAVSDMVDLASENTDFAVSAMAEVEAIDPGAGLPPAVQEDPDVESGSDISPSSSDSDSTSSDSDSASTAPVSSTPIPVPDPDRTPPVISK